MRDLWRRLWLPAAEVGDVVRRDLLVQSAQAAGFSNLMGLCLIAVVVLGLLGQGVGAGLLAWVVLSLVNAVVFGIGLEWLIRHEPDPPERIRLQQRLMSALYLVCGLCWGSLALLATPTGEHAAGRAVVCACLLIALAANIAFSSATPMPFLFAQGGLVLAGTVGFTRAGAVGLAGIMLFALVAALPLQKELYLQISGAKLLARRNHLLVEALREERAAVEQANLRLVEANVELSHRATRDPLTGLANRALFFEHLTSTLERSRPLGRCVAVIYLDVDRFKAVNDSLGHAAGDELLRQIGPRIAGVLRESDVPARLGGDEFVVLTVDAGPGSDARAVAERIRQAFEAPFRIDGRALQVTPSLGVADDDGSSSGETLVEQADAALYRAKEAGRNRVETFDVSLGSSLRRRVREQPAAGDLFGGDARVTAHFERVHDLVADAVAGVEVLVGVDEPDAAPLTGEALRDLAGRTGTSAALDEELLRRGGAFLAGLGPHPVPGYQVLVRLARPDGEFDEVARFLREGDVAGVRTGLSIAVGERQLRSDPATAARRIEAIRELGVRFVLDDVGRGASSLALLTGLPLDGVRVHPDVGRAAVTAGGEADRGMLAALAGVAGRRGIPLWARGVDTEAQLALLRTAGVRLVQGQVVPAH